jgi:hypothetical protein
MSQIGFVIVTHTDPQQFVRLTTVLNVLYSRPPIVIHHDLGRFPAQFAFSSNVEIVRPHVPTQWCGYSVVRATLAGLALLYAKSKKPDWFVLLSGSCYPTQRADVVLSDLINGGFDAYIGHEWIDPSCLRSSFQTECFRRYFCWLIGFPRATRATRLRTIGTPLLANLSSPYSAKGYRCYAGSQWFSANRRVAEYILAWHESNAWLGDHLEYRHCPDETYFHTILCNEPRLRVSGNTYRFTDWSLGGPHPKMLDLNDLSAILSSGAHFARKFLPGSPVLTRLDEYLSIAGYDGITQL